MPRNRPRKPCPYPECKKLILTQSRFCYDHHKVKAHRIKVGGQTLKYCANPDCKQSNPQQLFNFGKRAASWDGLIAQCKSCISTENKSEAGKKRWRKHNRTERAKERHRRYYHSEKGRAYRQSETYRAIMKLSYERRKINHPEKIKARIAVKNAVRKGELPKAATRKCQLCKKQAKEYHHESYHKKDRLN